MRFPFCKLHFAFLPLPKGESRLRKSLTLTKVATVFVINLQLIKKKNDKSVLDLRHAHFLNFNTNILSLRQAILPWRDSYFELLKIVRRCDIFSSTVIFKCFGFFKSKSTNLSVTTFRYPSSLAASVAKWDCSRFSKNGLSLWTVSIHGPGT